MAKVTGLTRRTRRLILRPLQMRDNRAWAASHCAMLDAKSAWELPKLPLDKIRYSDYAGLLAQAQSEIASGTRYMLGIFHREVGTLLGYLFIEDISEDRRTAVLDFRLINIYWGNGFAREAVREGMKFKGTLKLTRLELNSKSRSKLKL